MNSLYGRDFLSLTDFSGEELSEILSVAESLKKLQKQGEPHRYLEGKSVALIFQKPSTRTRVSFEVGVHQLGAKAIDIKQAEIGLGERETIADIARVLSRYVDGVMIRPFFHSDIVEFARFAEVPVINGLSDLFHPCQIMADMLTILEHHGRLRGLKLCFVGDGNNVCNTLIVACGLLGLEIIVACPPGYEPSLRLKQFPYRIEHDPAEALSGADVVYTDSWVSMGPPGQQAPPTKNFKGFTVTKKLMSRAGPKAIFMHCLPAHRGEEVAAEVIESKQSVVFDQAENRLHAQKAILYLLLHKARS